MKSTSNAARAGGLAAAIMINVCGGLSAQGRPSITTEHWSEFLQRTRRSWDRTDRHYPMTVSVSGAASYLGFSRDFSEGIGPSTPVCGWRVVGAYHEERADATKEGVLLRELQVDILRRATSGTSAERAIGVGDAVELKVGQRSGTTLERDRYLPMKGVFLIAATRADESQVAEVAVWPDRLDSRALYLVGTRNCVYMVGASNEPKYHNGSVDWIRSIGEGMVVLMHTRIPKSRVSVAPTGLEAKYWDGRAWSEPVVHAELKKCAEAAGVQEPTVLAGFAKLCGITRRVIDDGGCVDTGRGWRVERRSDAVHMVCEDGRRRLVPMRDWLVLEKDDAEVGHQLGVTALVAGRFGCYVIVMDISTDRVWQLDMVTDAGK